MPITTTPKFTPTLSSVRKTFRPIVATAMLTLCTACTNLSARENKSSVQNPELIQREIVISNDKKIKDVNSACILAFFTAVLASYGIKGLGKKSVETNATQRTECFLPEWAREWPIGPALLENKELCEKIKIMQESHDNFYQYNLPDFIKRYESPLNEAVQDSRPNPYLLKQIVTYIALLHRHIVLGSELRRAEQMLNEALKRNDIDYDITSPDSKTPEKLLSTYLSNNDSSTSKGQELEKRRASCLQNIKSAHSKQTLKLMIQMQQITQNDKELTKLETYANIADTIPHITWLRNYFNDFTTIKNGQLKTPLVNFFERSTEDWYKRPEYKKVLSAFRALNMKDFDFNVNDIPVFAHVMKTNNIPALRFFINNEVTFDYAPVFEEEYKHLDPIFKKLLDENKAKLIKFSYPTYSRISDAKIIKKYLNCLSSPLHINNCDGLAENNIIKEDGSINWYNLEIYMALSGLPAEEVAQVFTTPFNDADTPLIRFFKNTTPEWYQKDEYKKILGRLDKITEDTKRGRYYKFDIKDSDGINILEHVMNTNNIPALQFFIDKGYKFDYNPQFDEAYKLLTPAFKKLLDENKGKLINFHDVENAIASSNPDALEAVLSQTSSPLFDMSKLD